uniref:type I secretion C-terminal target domain-containing protein n=1 Tax=Psychromonas sp. Urea-02u-13 TaxID=2058326 RepID=UPI000CA98279
TENSETVVLRATTVDAQIVTKTDSGEGVITDNDVFSVSSTVSDDDDANENTNINLTNITHTGAIDPIASSQSIELVGEATLTSNGLAVQYDTYANNTLQAYTIDGVTRVEIFTIVVSSDNLSYEFTQLAGLDHSTNHETNESTVIMANFTALVMDGTTQVTDSTFSISITDDAPTVTGSLSITTANDGDELIEGFLTNATVSNDVTSVSWDISSLPELVFAGHDVEYSQADGVLTGSANGDAVFRISIDIDSLNDDLNPGYTFELLNIAGSIGTVELVETYTEVTGGNVGELNLGFGGFIIDNMSAVSAANGATATVNTNNSWIGVDGNWFDVGDELDMKFIDINGDDAQIKGLSITVEGKGSDSAAYEVNWSVDAIDINGNAITYNGVYTGAGNGDVIFEIPLVNDAIYFTDVSFSAPQLYGVNNKDETVEVSNSFRISIGGVTSNVYIDDIDLGFNYTLTDADADTASGVVNVSLVADDATLTAVVIDGMIQGLNYQASSGISGITDENGGFSYTAGDTVTFMLGNIVIGKIDMDNVSDNQVFLQDLAGVDRGDVNDEYVENMAVLLQSLDADGDAYNGIVITEAMRDAFSDDDFDLATISEQDLVAIIEETGHVALSEDAAMEHVQDMLELHAGLDTSEFDERVLDEELVGYDGVLVGGEGIDTFVWLSEDDGSGAEPATDHITDFELDNDFLDLSDLLNGETGGTLDEYLDFSFDVAGNTTIAIHASGESSPISQMIVLDGVNLEQEYIAEAGSNTEEQIINGLLGEDEGGPLIIDFPELEEAPPEVI